MDGVSGDSTAAALSNLEVLRLRADKATRAYVKERSGLEDLGLVEEVKTVDEKADEIARNVVATRCHEFVELNRDELVRSISTYAFNRGLTNMDVTDMLQHLAGNPRPIYVEPSRAVDDADFADEEGEGDESIHFFGD